MRFILLASVAALAACTSASGDDAPEGARSQRSFQVGEFRSVAVEGSHDVIVTVGGAPSVRAEGDQRSLERLEIRVENGRLKITSRSRGLFSFGRHHGVTVHVTAPLLEGASIGGSGDIRIDRVEGPLFEASIAGSGDMQIGALRTQRVNFAIAGSGEIRAAGEAEQADVSIAGSGDVALDGLATRRASVSIAGSGGVRLRASESVEGSIMGSGDLVVTGGARCRVSRMGSGNISCG